MLAKLNGDAAVAAAVRKCAEARPLEPVAWLQRVLKGRASTDQPPRRKSSHDLSGCDYEASISSDGLPKAGGGQWRAIAVEQVLEQEQADWPWTLALEASTGL